jgi:hypothetical protein
VPPPPDESFRAKTIHYVDENGRTVRVEREFMFSTKLADGETIVGQP